jgi:hypothetical protein
VCWSVDDHAVRFEVPGLPRLLAAGPELLVVYWERTLRVFDRRRQVLQLDVTEDVEGLWVRGREVLVRAASGLYAMTAAGRFRVWEGPDPGTGAGRGAVQYEDVLYYPDGETTDLSPARNVARRALRGWLPRDVLQIVLNHTPREWPTSTSSADSRR